MRRNCTIEHLPFSSTFSASLVLSFLASSAIFCYVYGAYFLFLFASTPAAACFLFFFCTTSEFDLYECCWGCGGTTGDMGFSLALALEADTLTPAASGFGCSPAFSFSRSSSCSDCSIFSYSSLAFSGRPTFSSAFFTALRLPSPASCSLLASS